MVLSLEDAIKIAAGRHDLSVIRIYDPRERNLPSIGLVHAKDAEPGETAIINTSSRKARREYAAWWTSAWQQADNMMRRRSIDSVDIATDQDYVKALISLFRSR